MIRVIAHAKAPPDHLGHPLGRPPVTAKPVGLGPARQHARDLRPLLRRQARPQARRWPTLQGGHASGTRPLHPLADRSLTDPERGGNGALCPARLFELPGAFPPLLAPVSFRWCSHAPDDSIPLLPFAGLSRSQLSHRSRR